MAKHKATKRPVGRPPMYKSVEEMQEKIDAYFRECEGEKALDENGNPILTKYGYLYKKDPKPPTVTGLALALGLSGRQALLNYQGKPEYMDAITRAKVRCEEYAESRLYDKEGANGAKFSLANNFRWVEKPDGVDVNQSTVINVEITDE